MSSVPRCRVSLPASGTSSLQRSVPESRTRTFTRRRGRAGRSAVRSTTTTRSSDQRGTASAVPLNHALLRPALWRRSRERAAALWKRPGMLANVPGSIRVARIFGIVIGVAGVIIAFAADAAASSVPSATWLQVVSAVAGYVGPINMVVAVFNLVPGFPLDGGRVLRAAIWGITKDRLRATRIAARGGQVFAGILVSVGVAFVFGIGFPQNELQGILYGFIGYFVWNAASSSLQQERLASVVGGAKVGPLMTADFRSTPPGVMVGQIIRDFVLPMNLRAIPVVSGDRLVGLITIADLRKVEQDRWATTPVEQVMTPASELATVSPDDPLGTALERFGGAEVPLLPVVKDGRLIGVLYREAVIGYVRMQEMLAPQGRR